ncbi:Protein-L-isoaspartate O-methyltransferase domain-containing protein 1, partial [Stegodyphus mimosarum]
MGGAVSAGEDNDELIDKLAEAEYIKSPIVEKIFREVDRANYYLEGCKENAYRDMAWKHGHIHLSAPCIYSEVMESLKLGPGMSFLNLGSGTGYLSTMAGLLLGTYGVNHGVELHRDVVNYARSKLEDFQNSSPALDKYEFCAPSFVVGNCLLLDSSIQQYDRVYCGASCPLEHENYMKNLVRIGGILVMPLKDHLLQVTRTSETSYEVKNLLPVSFASLVLPKPNEALTSVKLPEMCPLSLQELCRSTVRILLRRNVEIENPSLKERKKPHPHKRKRGRRRMKRIVIPIFEDRRRENMGSRRGSQSDVDDSRRDSHSDVENRRDSLAEASDSGRDSQADTSSRRHGYSRISPDTKIVLNINNPRSGQSVQKMEVTIDSEDPESQIAAEDDDKKDQCENSTPKNGKRKLSQPGNGDSGIDNISDDSFLEEGPTDSEKYGASSNPSSSQSSVESMTRNSAYLKRSAEENDDDDGALDPRTNVGEDRKFANYKNTAVIFKRVAFSDADSDEFDDLDSDSGKDCFSMKNKEDSNENSDTFTYTYFMKQKIKQLPLPQTLKIFVNLSRPV